MIPLFHDLAGERVLVFGGGPVGARKARRFAREADTTVVSPTFADADFGDADLVRASPGPDDVGAWVADAEPALVVVATDDAALNDAAAAAARECDALVNRADRSGRRDADSVVVPATVRDGQVTVAVGTGGTSPALSAALRDRVAGEVAGAGTLAAVTARLREGLRAADVSPDRRREAVRAVADSPAVWKSLRTSEDNAVDEAMRVVADVLDCPRDEAHALLAGGDGRE
ncbi:MAG: bifunctional precorrin-2 dehydrogenase/sirohydrochlorin ferrochelatase [Halobacteriaceae archaeon]